MSAPDHHIWFVWAPGTRPTAPSARRSRDTCSTTPGSGRTRSSPTRPPPITSRWSSWSSLTTRPDGHPGKGPGAGSWWWSGRLPDGRLRAQTCVPKPQVCGSCRRSREVMFSSSDRRAQQRAPRMFLPAVPTPGGQSRTTSSGASLGSGDGRRSLPRSFSPSVWRCRAPRPSGLRPAGIRGPNRRPPCLRKWSMSGSSGRSSSDRTPRSWSPPRIRRSLTQTACRSSSARGAMDASTRSTCPTGAQRRDGRSAPTQASTRPRLSMRRPVASTMYSSRPGILPVSSRR